MVLGVADNFYPSAAGQHHVALRDAFRRVIRTFGMNVRTDGANEIADIELIENHHSVYVRQRGQNFSALILWNARTPRAFERARARIRVNSHHQPATKFLGRAQVTHMAYMEQIKTAVGENNLFALFPPLLREPGKLGNIQYFLYRRRQISPP